MGTSPITLGIGNGARAPGDLITSAQRAAPPAQNQPPRARQAEFVVCDQTIEHCFRKLKTSGLEIRPVYHWTPRRIMAHVQLCTLALQIQRAAEIRTGLAWSHLAHELAALKAVRYRTEARAIVQRTRIRSELGDILKKLAVSIPKKLLAVSEPAANPLAA
jgi:hypothetical protein